MAVATLEIHDCKAGYGFVPKPAEGGGHRRFAGGGGGHDAGAQGPGRANWPGARAGDGGRGSRAAPAQGVSGVLKKGLKMLKLKLAWAALAAALQVCV